MYLFMTIFSSLVFHNLLTQECEVSQNSKVETDQYRDGRFYSLVANTPSTLLKRLHRSTMIGFEIIVF